MAKQSAPKSQPSGSFTDTARVHDLVRMMAENDLTELELVEDKSRIVLKRGSAQVVYAAAAPQTLAPAPAAAAAAPAAPIAPAAVEEKLLTIKSPMVGTFYTAANPETPAFVSVGSNIGEDSVVCIIEAMKVFNEIRAELAGSIAKILVQNGQAVEYNQPLFLVRPN